MKTLLVFLCPVIFLISCQKNKELPNKQELFRKEVHAIDWTKVDKYPSYESCDSLETKEDRYVCFYEKLTEDIYTNILEYPAFYSERGETDTLILNVKIKPNFSPEIMLARNNAFEINPQVADSIFDSISKKLLPIDPATKRGIPVQTELTIKIKLNKK